MNAQDTGTKGDGRGWTFTRCPWAAGSNNLFGDSARRSRENRWETMPSRKPGESAAPSDA